jgi:2,4-dienoyl-CoA reductase-like NADH-dependent reductase (Old Yellow Enzyme family)
MWAGSTPLTEDQGAYPVVGPSAIAFGSNPVPHALTPAEIHAIIGAWGDAAGRAARAGFDFVEIHAAHGYLLHQFLSPLSNTRADNYGGSLENRARIVLGVVKAVRAAVPDTTVVAMRVSATDWVPGGWGPEETAKLAEWARAAGLDHLDVSTGGLVEDAVVPVGPAYQAPFGADLKKATGLSVNSVGIIDSAAMAEELVASGDLDAVMLGRPFLRNPHLPIAWATELGVEPTEVCPPQYSGARWRQYYGR